MNVLLWILQVLLAVAFLLHGWLYLSPPPEILEQLNALLPTWFRIFIGVAEIVAAVGLVLPAATRILPKLTPAAAAGLMIVTLSAFVLHVTRSETGSAVITALLFALTAFVSYGRWKLRPISPRAAAQARLATMDSLWTV
jgi:uncharacterized membrane protein YphA (DoxX/SURF4 family)